MKAVISNKIYMSMPPNANSIKSTLTYKIHKPFSSCNHFAAIETIRQYKVLPGNILVIPQARQDLIPEGYEIIDKRIISPVEYPNTKYSLYENQVEIYNQVSDSCIINAMPGWGKTFTALHVLKKLGQKSLIVTHTVSLRDQWRDEIIALFGFEPGIIGSGEDSVHPIITVSNIQTLRKKAKEYSKDFGLVVLDECLDYNTMIQTLEMGKQKLGKIVNQRLPVSVKSLDLTTGKEVFKPIVNWFKNKEDKCLKISTDIGSVKATKNHTFFIFKDNLIQKEKAENLKVGDILICQHSSLSEDYKLKPIKSIEEATLTYGHRYNIEVKDTHNYFAESILVSNCHHVPATTFSSVLDESYSKYKIGLSATLTRKDKKHVLFPDYFGKEVYIAPEANTMKPKVKLIDTGITLGSASGSWSDTITKLTTDLNFIQLVCNLAKIQIIKGHKVLVIADRVQFLKNIGGILGDRCVVITGQEGDRVQAKQDVLAGDIDCIVGSRHIFSEGISINNLSCVILAVPINNDALLEQIIGRIQRTHEDKLDPVVLDLQFKGASARKQQMARAALYIRKGWNIGKL